MERPRSELNGTEPAGKACHTCERDFEGLFDFPVVQVVSFDRTPIPNDLVLPDDWEIFVDPDSGSGNRRVPANVKSLFEDDNVVKGRRQDGRGSVWRDTVDYEGWQWSRIKHGDSPKNWSYHKAQLLPGGGIVIATAVEPYLNHLNDQVGKLVRPTELEPPKVKIDLPEEAKLKLREDALSFVNDEENGSTGNAKLVLHSYRGRAAGMTLLGTVAELGNLNYEGRIYK